MNIKEIHEIELDLSRYGKAKIKIRRKDGYIIEEIQPKWLKRFEVYEKIVSKWLKEISKES